MERERESVCVCVTRTHRAPTAKAIYRTHLGWQRGQRGLHFSESPLAVLACMREWLARRVAFEAKAPIALLL
jgi:hypothetical protein